MKIVKDFPLFKGEMSLLSCCCCFICRCCWYCFLTDMSKLIAYSLCAWIGCFSWMRRSKSRAMLSPFCSPDGYRIGHAALLTGHREVQSVCPFSTNSFGIYAVSWVSSTRTAWVKLRIYMITLPGTSTCFLSYTYYLDKSYDHGYHITKLWALQLWHICHEFVAICCHSAF